MSKHNRFPYPFGKYGGKTLIIYHNKSRRRLIMIKLRLGKTGNAMDIRIRKLESEIQKIKNKLKEKHEKSE